MAFDAWLDVQRCRTRLVHGSGGRIGGDSSDTPDGSAQPEAPEPLYVDGPEAQVYLVAAWCRLFTDEGTSMRVDARVQQVQILLGDPSDGLLPQSLVPMVNFLEPPALDEPRAERVTMKGSSAGRTSPSRSRLRSWGQDRDQGGSRHVSTVKSA